MTMVILVLFYHCETNLIEIERLKKFHINKKVDEEINQLTYYNSNLDFTLLTTEFDTFDFSKSDIVDDITEEEFNDASDFDECEYSVDSPLVRLDAYGLQFVYPCSNTQMRYMVV
jgi:hypothetical protein